MNQLLPQIKARFEDDNGNPLVGGKVYTYSAGTQNPLPTYTDINTIPGPPPSGNENTNPVILDDRGEADIWLLAGIPYKIVLDDVNDNLIYSVDNVTGSGGSGGGGVDLGKVFVSALDPVAGFLGEKLTAGDNVELVINTSPAGDTITISAILDGKVLVSGTDTNAGFLFDKISSDDGSVIITDNGSTLDLSINPALLGGNLREVGQNSTNQTDSIYTMTDDVDVAFVRSDQSDVIRFDDGVPGKAKVSVDGNLAAKYFATDPDAIGTWTDFANMAQSKGMILSTAGEPLNPSLSALLQMNLLDNASFENALNIFNGGQGKSISVLQNNSSYLAQFEQDGVGGNLIVNSASVPVGADYPLLVQANENPLYGARIEGGMKASIDAEKGIKVGDNDGANSDDGTIRYNPTTNDLEGQVDGGQWKSLTAGDAGDNIDNYAFRYIGSTPHSPQGSIITIPWAVTEYGDAPVNDSYVVPVDGKYRFGARLDILNFIFPPPPTGTVFEVTFFWLVNGNPAPSAGPTNIEWTHPDQPEGVASTIDLELTSGDEVALQFRYVSTSFAQDVAVSANMFGSKLGSVRGPAGLPGVQNLREVGDGSTNATDSTYTMTSAVDVVFEDSTNAPVMTLQEDKLQVDKRLDVDGNMNVNDTGTSTAFIVKGNSTGGEVLESITGNYTVNPHDGASYGVRIDDANVITSNPYGQQIYGKFVTGLDIDHDDSVGEGLMVDSTTNNWSARFLGGGQGSAYFDNGLTLGNNTTGTTNGSLRHTGVDIEGLIGGVWTSLTQASGSNTLNDVSVASTNAGDSTYDMTSGVAVKFADPVGGDYVTIQDADSYHQLRVEGELRGERSYIQLDDTSNLVSTGSPLLINDNRTNNNVALIAGSTDSDGEALSLFRGVGNGFGGAMVTLTDTNTSAPFTMQMFPSANTQFPLDIQSGTNAQVSGNFANGILVGDTTYPTPANGTIRYNTNDLQGYADGEWKSLTGGGGGSAADFTKFPYIPQVTPPLPVSEGTTYYDLNKHNLVVQTGTDVNLDVGRENWVRAYNNTGATITNGTAVYVQQGVAEGTETVAQIQLAQANSKNTCTFVGLATQDIPNGTYGEVASGGIVRDMDTSSFSNGDILYVSATTAGALTNIAPAFPNFECKVGRVLQVSATGEVYVDPDVDPPIGSGGSVASGLEVFPISSCNNVYTINLNSNQGMYMSCRVIPTQNITVTNLSILVQQAGTISGGVRFGIYDPVSTGDILLAQTAEKTTNFVVGINTLALTSPISLNANQAYMFAFQCRGVNGCNIVHRDGGLILNAGNNLHFSRFDGANAPDTGSGMISPVGYTSSSNQMWMIAT